MESTEQIAKLEKTVGKDGKAVRGQLEAVKNAKWVAEAYSEKSTRVEVLSWTHHADTTTNLTNCRAFRQGHLFFPQTTEYSGEPRPAKSSVWNVYHHRWTTYWIAPQNLLINLWSLAAVAIINHL